MNSLLVCRMGMLETRVGSAHEVERYRSFLSAACARSRCISSGYSGCRVQRLFAGGRCGHPCPRLWRLHLATLLGVCLCVFNLASPPPCMNRLPSPRPRSTLFCFLLHAPKCQRSPYTPSLHFRCPTDPASISRPCTQPLPIRASSSRRLVLDIDKKSTVGYCSLGRALTGKAAWLLRVAA